MTPAHRHQPLTLDSWAAEMAAQGYAPATIASKKAGVASCANHAGVDPADLSREDILTWLSARPRARWTRIKYVTWLRDWTAYCGRPHQLDGVRRPTAPAGVPKPASERDLSALLAKARNPRDRAWVLLGAFCGLRAHESAKVAIDDLKQVAGGEWVLRVLGKGGQLAVVPCPPVVVDALMIAADGQRTGRLWPRATTRTVQTRVSELARQAGVHVTSHQLRHRYGTVFYAACQDLLLTQRAMRHRSPTTTAGYAAIAGDRAQVVASALPGALVDEVSDHRPRPRLRLVQ